MPLLRLKVLQIRENLLKSLYFLSAILLINQNPEPILNVIIFNGNSKVACFSTPYRVTGRLNLKQKKKAINTKSLRF